jgi:hypothetical protein
MLLLLDLGEEVVTQEGSGDRFASVNGDNLAIGYFHLDFIALGQRKGVHKPLWRRYLALGGDS